MRNDSYAMRIYCDWRGVKAIERCMKEQLEYLYKLMDYQGYYIQKLNESIPFSKKINF